MNLYETLGVEADAGADEIKKAYRAKAMREHPDREGGSKEAFQKIQHAYDVLGDEERRKRYDETGKETDQQTHEQELQEALAQLLMYVLGKSDERHQNIVDAMRSHIKSEQSSIRNKVKGMRGEVEKRERALERLKTSGKNFLGESLKRNIAGLKADILKAEEHIRQGDELLALLKDYSYQCDVWTPDQTTSTFAFGNAFHGMFNQRYEGG